MKLIRKLFVWVGILFVSAVLIDVLGVEIFLSLLAGFLFLLYVMGRSENQNSDIQNEREGLNWDDDEDEDDDYWEDEDDEDDDENPVAEGGDSGWIPRGEIISIHGRKIPGMVYVGKPPKVTIAIYKQKCRAYIDPSLRVSRNKRDKHGDEMFYWPGYSDIPSECRATYLDWLASGAKDKSYNVGYMFLYFYGLERRFFVDQPSLDEKLEILKEVRRLARRFGDNRSVQRYLNEFIDVAACLTTAPDDIQPVFENVTREVPFSVKLIVGAHIAKGINLNADWLLSWFLCHPETRLRTPGKRCRDEFISFFKIRFYEQFPEGLKIRKPKSSFQESYFAASGEFDIPVNFYTDREGDNPVPDISSIKKPLKIAQQIADEVMAELEKFSRYLGRNPDGHGSIEAHALLPVELRKIFPPKQLSQIKSWARKIINKGGLVKVADIALRLESNRPVTYDKSQLTRLADALARLGFGLAPDPRFALRTPKFDEPVVLFDLGGSVEQLEEVSNNYKAALVELALAAFIAQVDGTITELERKNLQAQACSADRLSEHEQRQLQANLTQLLAVPPDITLLRRKLKEADADQKSAIRTTLVAATHASGVVKPEEVAAIEKIYRILGLDTNLAYSDIHAGEVPDAPVRVRVAKPSKPGETIPNERPKRKKKLDPKRIASIQKDTERVSATLAEIFSTEETEKVVESEPSSTLAELDEKHYALVREIITRQYWSSDDFSDLVVRHGLMVAGALEAINEWSFGIYDEALIEEYEGYDISPDIAYALAENFEKEKN